MRSSTASRSSLGFLVLVAAIASCKRPPARVTVRVSGGDACEPAVTVVTTPPESSGEPTIHRELSVRLPYETLATLPSRTSIAVMANAFHCPHLECTLLVGGREVAHRRGLPMPDDGISANCDWRAP